MSNAVYLDLADIYKVIHIYSKFVSNTNVTKILEKHIIPQQSTVITPNGILERTVK